MRNSYLRLIGAAVFPLIIVLTSAYSQSGPSSIDRQRAHIILKDIKQDLLKNYYDPNFHGMDVEARFKTADDRLDGAKTLGQLFGIIAQVVLDLDDSHTRFIPPARHYRVDYGWKMQMIGEKCFAVAVKPGSDAEAKGLVEGDEINTIDGNVPTRDVLWKIEYDYRSVRPRNGMRLVVTKPDGRQQQLDIAAKVQQGKRLLDFTLQSSSTDFDDYVRQSENESRLNRHRFIEVAEKLFVWKMPHFDLDKSKVDEFAGKFRKHEALILDLRGNGGGFEDTLVRMVSNLFDHDVKIGDIKRRKETKPLVAKTRGEDSFKGKLIVLIDSDSGSAAELFARLVQIEKRGIVIGDRSAGAVMRSRFYSHALGVDDIVPWGVSITDADMIMTDGQSLERTGVTPDEFKLAAPVDLAGKRDPVLAYAMSLAGITMDSQKAGALFPQEWIK